MTPEQYRQVNRICREALDLVPGDRAVYLAEACGGDAALRREVESLLAYDAKGGGAIDQPAVEVAARAMAAEQAEEKIDDQAESPDKPAAQSLTGQSLGHYRRLSLLGRGGMGEVYLGEDTRLGRKVAIKLLPAVFRAQPERVRRFAQEARAASALNHPNIITIHEIGEATTEQGATRYIVTEYVEGATLRQRMASAPQTRVKLAEAIDIGLQIAAALAAAHETGIIHRDIKPENVMVRRDGIVKVLDFGLAKLTDGGDGGTKEPGERANIPPSFPLSTPGLVMGTPRYMSPEQARGLRVDARSDIFSLGVLLYEMVAGRAPFEGATTSDVIAAILRQEPPPLARYAPEAPAELERVVAKALRKDREERYQVTKDFLFDLRSLKQELDSDVKAGRANGAVASARMTSGAEYIVTQLKRRRRRALITLAILVLVAVAAFFHFNRKPALTDKDTVLLADFVNTTGDADFDGTLKQALAVQLEQTPFLNFFPEERVRETLRLMSRAPEERVTREVAREICQRQGLKALITGAVASLGSHYVLTLEAVNGQNGEVIARQQVEAAGKEQVLRSLGQAAAQLREKLGESLASIQRFDTQLEQATTSSLDAFKAFSFGREKSRGGKFRESIPFYKRATELDSNFAVAYASLADQYANTGQPELAAEAAAKGFALRERVTEREKFRLAFNYYSDATGEFDKAMETLELWKQTYPQDYSPRNLLIPQYRLIGQFEKSIEAAGDAIKLFPNFVVPRLNLAHSLFRTSRFDEARAAYKELIERRRDTVGTHFCLYIIGSFQSDAEAMRRELEWLNGNALLDAHLLQAWTYLKGGQLRQARGFSFRAMEVAAQRDLKDRAGFAVAGRMLNEAGCGLCRQVKQDAAQALAFSRVGHVTSDFTVPTLPGVALALALCGEVGEAQKLAEELTQRYPKATQVNLISLPAIRAALELHRGQADRAVQLLEVASPYESRAWLWPTYLRGQACLRLNQGGAAAVEFQKILDHPGWAYPSSTFYALAPLGLARAAAMSGAVAKSRKAYQDFFALWKDADADLPILIEAEKEYKRLLRRP
jgi:serine/threonine protein kinase/predicted Zn-dependent protease